MNIHLGTLEIKPAIEHSELFASSVADALSRMKGTERVGVAEIDPAFSDTEAFCEYYGVGADQGANCVILEAKRSGEVWYAACVILGSTRADVNGLARKSLGARKTSFSSMDTAISETGMEYGAITPVGLPEDWSILVDKAVVETEYVIIGSGKRGSKLAVPGSFLAGLPNVQILEGLGK